MGKVTVIRVLEGNAFLIQERKKAIRIYGLDAPSPGEIGYKKATDSLRKLIEGKSVDITPKGEDSYGRIVAAVKLNSRSVNKALVNS